MLRFVQRCFCGVLRCSLQAASWWTLGTLAGEESAGRHRWSIREKHRSELPWAHGQIFARVLPLAIDDDLEVDVAASGIAGGARQGNDLALAYPLSYTNEDQGIVAVSGLDPIAVVNGDAISRMAGP